MYADQWRPTCSVLVGASTSGAGSNPISGIGDIIKGGTDLMKAGIKHRQEMKEKMIFFAVLTIKTEVSTMIKLTTSVESNLLVLLETRLSSMYSNATNVLGMKILYIFLDVHLLFLV